MGPVRTVVLPVLRLLVWVVIAVCLVYIAFLRGGPDASGDPAVPSATITAPETTVARADVVNTVTLTGSITEDPATTVKSTAAGTVGRLRVAAGDPVDEGDPLFTVVVPVAETPSAPAPADPTAPLVPAPAPTPRTKTVTVTATVPGTVATLDVLPQQSVDIGTAVATISPGVLRASAPLTQADQFRLLAPPTVAKVTVPGGPGGFDCTELRTGRPPASAGGGDAATGGFTDPYADPSTTQTGANLTCRVPDGIQVFAGATATIEVTAGEARGVLVAPVTAVKGTVGTGSVWVLDDAAGPEGTETPVELGLTDGENVEIRAGVAEGARILQFVPNSDAVGDPGMVMGGFGG
ncbi:hypothetical protein [Kineococcus glutinatus]|uniref:Multidrug efflux pump subunit AcrA (Membrane-fusion protein) n=1 Tax=Kineococcus glutinatus TaxID=1070872 RepID=A0ABP9HNK8_9ACTN